MEGKMEGRNIAITNSPVQTIYKISLEYDFNYPEYQVVQCYSSSYIPVFVATHKIQKDSRTYISMGKKSKTRKECNHSSAQNYWSPTKIIYLATKRNSKINFTNIYKTNQKRLCYISGRAHVNDFIRGATNQ